ncbi:MAG: hypothetical protein M1828_005161 [Chrysothrix sp. TS-e1954]|nr:MAG: hypothetical protein M1828_005161 [Chrysothrix sp. TS-e1954]
MPNAGNPFRRRPTGEQPTIAPPPLEQEAQVTPERGAGRKNSSTTVKRVRIQTPPPLSPDTPVPVADESLADRLNYTQRSGSPPPPPAYDAQPGNEDDPFSRDEAVAPLPEGEVLDNTLKNAKSSTDRPNATGGIVNPFSRTLETLEPHQRERTGDDGKQDNLTSSNDDARAPSSSVLDVDSFTRMLMTGSKDGVLSREGREYENSSNSDIAKASRQVSRGDIPQEHDSLSDADTTSDDAEASTRKEDKAVRPKPPPPKHRHGKSVLHTGPQTVPFTDFTASEPSATLSQPPQSTSVDLPPLPQPPEPMSQSAEPRPYSKDETKDDPVSMRRDITNTDLPSASSRVKPPPIPLARRSTPKHGPRQASPDTASAEPSRRPSGPEARHSVDSIASNKMAKAPPPPPSRRGTVKSKPLSDQSSTSEAGSVMETSSFAENYSSTTEASSGRRSPTPMNSSSRSSSISEKPPMPPPPPPRRRGSTKSSVASSRHEQTSSSNVNRRTSQESGRSISGANETTDSSTETKRSSSGDVLADLSALQAEVDALRHSFRRIN